MPDREALKAKTSDDRKLAAYHDWQSPLGETLQGMMHVIYCDSEMPPPPPGELIVRPEYQAFLKDVACRYDAIAVGGAALRRVMLNESESAVFSEYSLSVEEWILPNAGERVIRVSRAGGLAKLADGSALGIEIQRQRRTARTAPVPADAHSRDTKFPHRKELRDRVRVHSATVPRDRIWLLAGGILIEPV